MSGVVIHGEPQEEIRRKAQRKADTVSKSRIVDGWNKLKLLFIAALVFISEQPGPEVRTFFGRQFNISMADYFGTKCASVRVHYPQY